MKQRHARSLFDYLEVLPEGLVEGMPDGAAILKTHI